MGDRGSGPSPRHGSPAKAQAPHSRIHPCSTGGRDSYQVRILSLDHAATFAYRGGRPGMRPAAILRMPASMEFQSSSSKGVHPRPGSGSVLMAAVLHRAPHEHALCPACAQDGHAASASGPSSTFAARHAHVSRNLPSAPRMHTAVRPTPAAKPKMNSPIWLLSLTPGLSRDLRSPSDRRSSVTSGPLSLGQHTPSSSKEGRRLRRAWGRSSSMAGHLREAAPFLPDCHARASLATPRAARGNSPGVFLGEGGYKPYPHPLLHPSHPGPSMLTR